MRKILIGMGLKRVKQFFKRKNQFLKHKTRFSIQQCEKVFFEKIHKITLQLEKKFLKKNGQKKLREIAFAYNYKQQDFGLKQKNS